MQKRKSFFNNEMEQRFSLRKYTIGLCSVCLGFVTIGMGSQTVKADTVNDAEKSSAVQENKAQGAASANADALPESKTNTSDSATANSNTTPTETKEDKAGSVAMVAPKMNTTSTGANVNTATPTETKFDKANLAAVNSNNALAQTKLVQAESATQSKVNGTSTETKPNELGSSAANPNTVSTEVKPNAANPASLAKIKLAKALNVKLVKQADASKGSANVQNPVDPVEVANEKDGAIKNDDTTVNQAIDDYANQKQTEVNQKQTEVGDKVIIRPSDKQPVTVYKPGEREAQVKKIKQKIDDAANEDKAAIEDYKKNQNRQIILQGEESEAFKNQGLSVDDEKDSKINQISVDHKINQISVDHKDFTLKDITLLKDQSKKIGGIDGIDVTYTSKMTNKEQKDMKIDSDNKVIIDLQHDQCQGTDITVTYDNLNNSYYLENIDDKTNKIKISKIKRTFSDITPGDTIFKSDGIHDMNPTDGVYDKCDGPQLIIYNDPSDGFFYNNITKVSVKDIYYDDNDNEITFDTKNDKNKAWIFVTSLNSNGTRNVRHNVEKVRAQGLNNSPVSAEKIKGSTVTNHIKGWWYSDENNWFNKNPDWDNNTEDNRFGFVGTVAFQYQLGMTLQYWADDSQWGSHWASMQTQVVSSLNQRVIIYDHIKDDTENVTGNDDVNMTVHYVMDDGSKAPSDSKQTVNFTEDGTQDLVTKHIDWTPADSQTFKDVVTPKMTGYTPDKDKVAGQTVNFGNKDIEATVKYTANTQTATITYIDDTTKTNLKSKETSGKFGQAIIFETTPTVEIENYKKQGYVLVSNTFDNNKYQADNGSNVFYVHLKHDTKNVSRDSNVNMTVHYVMDDNSAAPSDNKQTLSFTEDGIQDLVTKHIDWTPADSQTFKDVATKSIVGYTPDKENVAGQTVNFGDKDINVTVHYSANAQTAKITYIDDTTKNNLYSQAANGKFGQTITFTTAPSDEIENYKKQGYVLVSNTFDNNKYQADNSRNVFYVHLKHDTKNVSRDSNVNMTVHYVMDDNSAAPSDNKQTLSFTEDGIQDLVTKHIDWIPAVSQTFKDVATKSIVGYTPDQDNVAGQIVNFDDQDVEVTVRYNANTQNAKITYIDDTTKTNLKSKETSGKFGQAITFTTAPSVEIENYKKQGYVLVSSTFDNNKYQADNSRNVFYVHLKHGTKNVSRDSNVNMTVHYVMDDNSAAPSDSKQTLSFTENGIQDLVTKHIDWTPTVSQTFKDVATKSIVGYTPDQDNVAGQTVNFDDQDVEVTVRYNANTQNAKITYIDDTTKTNLDSKETSGKFGQAINFTTAPADEIENYKKQGYVLVSNTFDNNKYQADNSNNVFYVHFVHGTKNVSRSDDVKMTVHYVMDDNSEAPSDNKQSLSFTENGIQDLVTKHIDWTPAVSQTLKDIDSPVLTGYTADIKTVNGKVVNFGDNDVNVTVHYSANTQTATITYIDDTEKKTLGSDNQNGKFNQVIAFEHDPAEVIKGLEEKGYVFVSNTFDNQKYQADNSNNVFEVHLKHKTESVTRNGAVTRTIHYLYDDGNTAKPDKIQTVSFNETGTKDYVTNKTTWDNDDAQTVDSVITPSITGYTPDKDKVAGQTFKFGDKNVEVTVRYNANAQTAMITYIDDTAKKTLGSDNQNGKFNQVITFEHDPAEVIKGLEEKGYQLVSDNFKPGIKYQADNKSNNFEVHLVHTYEPVETSQIITETVHYIDDNGKPVAPDHVATVVVKVTGTRDKVTNSITWNTPGTGHFDKVLSPVVPNMTPDKKFIPGRDVQYGDSDITESVVYTLDEMPGEPGKSNKPVDSTPKTPENPNKPGDSTPKTPENPNKPGDSTPKTPGKSNKPVDSTPKTPVKSNKPVDSTPKTPGKSNKPGDSTPKTSVKSNKPGKEVSKTTEKPNNSGKEVSKQRGMIVETTIPEKHVGSRTADSQALAKSTTKRELPQTGATISVGIWVGLASMIASLGLLGAIKKRKKN